MLDDLQLDQIADPQLREVIRRLMNLVEQLSAQNQQLREENQRLRACHHGRCGRADVS